MDAAKLSETLSEHKKWLAGAGGKRASFTGADLTGAVLIGVDLSRADFTGANLTGANLSKANLTNAVFTGADLTEADLPYANLTWAYLARTNLSRVDFFQVNLTEADLTGANLTSASLNEANLKYANLTGANLAGTRLTLADLTDANLSGVTGLLTARQFLTLFQTDDDGVLVWKRIGETAHTAPAHWKIEPGSFLEEVCNPLPTVECGCGVNFGTEDWCRRNHCRADLWLCRIHWLDLAGVVIPYNNDGKARCSRLQLGKLGEKGAR